MDKKNNINVYIAGMGHSGSTLLECLLGRHSQIAGCGELFVLSKNIACNEECGCFKKIVECEVWKKVREAMLRDKGIDIFKDPYALKLGAYLEEVVIDAKHQTKIYVLKTKIRRLIQGLALRFRVFSFLYFFILSRIEKETENTFYLYNVLRDIQAKRIIVDSSKNYARAVELHKRKGETQQKIILLIRDGRALLYSHIKRGFSKNRLYRMFNKFYKLHAKTIKRKVSAEDLIEIRYEDLAQKPKETLEKICDFLNVDFQSDMLTAKDNLSHSVNGNTEAKRSVLSGVRFDDQWREHLSADDLKRFNKRCGSVNKSIGYK